MAFGAVEKLQIAIEATYRGDGARKAKGDLSDLDQQATRSKRSMADFAKGAAAMGAALGAAAVVVKQAYDAIKEGAELNTAANQFDILTAKINTTSDALLGRMREATRGFATDADLIASANQIISLGLAKTEEDVTKCPDRPPPLRV